MLRQFILTASIALVLLASSAEGQGLTKVWRGRTFTAQDREVITSTVEQQIHGKPVGTVAPWSNTTEGHSGTVKLLSKSTRQNMPCERIQYDMKAPKSARYVFTSCQLPDGNWKFAG